MKPHVNNFASGFALAGLLSCSSVTWANDTSGYGFESAAQEITQLFWLAETADLCGWTSHDDAMRFKHFAVRFLKAHLSDTHQLALVSLVTESGYEDQVRRVAQEGAGRNCSSAHWHTGWTAYKAAADQHDRDF